MQAEVTRNYIIPFLEGNMSMDGELHVLEVGCGEAGVLKAFLEAGHSAVGIELQPARLELAKGFLKDYTDRGKVALINKNIYDIDPENDLEKKFDLIILKDVIEHIPEQDNLMAKLSTMLSPGGIMFFGFPPWHMPFGGHQQICGNKLLKNLPYFHLLPSFLYRGILKLAGEKDRVREELLELKETGITIERFERIVGKLNLRIVARKIYLTNPIYKYKFGLPVIPQLPLLRNIPYLRNLYSMGVYYLVTSG